jgi:hypothetical protein
VCVWAWLPRLVRVLSSVCCKKCTVRFMYLGRHVHSVEYWHKTSHLKKKNCKLRLPTTAEILISNCNYLCTNCEHCCAKSITENWTAEDCDLFRRGESKETQSDIQSPQPVFNADFMRISSECELRWCLFYT